MERPNPVSVFWKQHPFLRLLLLLAAGILTQWYVQPAPLIIIMALTLAILCIVAGRLVQPVLPGYALLIKGAGLQLLPLVSGMWLVHLKDVRNHASWVGGVQQSYTAVTAVITEPLSEKTKTWKALARITSLCTGDSCQQVSGNCIVYIQKDSIKPALQYGSVIVFKQALQPIGNNGNPGAFDYRRNSLFKGITHQVFLKANGYRVLAENEGNLFQLWLFNTREALLRVVQRFVPGKTEQGVAEALLIGYRDDLDKALTEAYAGTGTIHVIAISGLHLGMIYLMLLTVLKPLEKKRAGRWLQAAIVISVLWLFTLLAGAAPSILRSAIMFSCIMLGQSLRRPASVYNTLAASAFIILCINPFSLWDVGFQLSYAAVLSIVVFMRPVYNLLYVKNKWIDYLWKLNAVTIAAQILTLPVIIFHFHQFPNLFLFTNLVAVPLSSCILAGELILLVLCWLPALAIWIGKIISWLVTLMNGYIQWCSTISFAVSDYLQMNMVECWCLYAVIIFTGWWLLANHKRAFTAALCSLLLFGSLRLYAHTSRQQQLKVVVYNVPKQQAIDFIESGRYTFKGDSIMKQTGFLQNFHLKPARIEMGIRPGLPATLQMQPPLYRLNGKMILVLDSNYNITGTQTGAVAIDLLVLSKNTRATIARLAQQLTIKQVVADASNPLWKTDVWKKDCDSLGIPFHAAAQQGAFILDCSNR